MKTEHYTRSSHIRNFFLSMLLLFSVAMSVHSQSLTVIDPNGGEVWTYGQTEIISWSGDDLGSVVRIDFSYDGGTNWWYFGEVPSGPNGGSASLGVPNVETTNAILKISDVINTNVTDMSDAPFTVVVPPIFIYEPYTGSIVFVSTTVYISWTVMVFGIDLLDAEISLDNGQTYTLVAENITATVGYAYLALSDTPSDSCILRLSNAADPTQFGLSQPFAILPLPVYSLITPAGGEIVNTLSPLTISWTVQDPSSEYCYFEYSVNNGQTWEYIDYGINEGLSGTYVWITPEVNSGECLIRISDYYALSQSDTSEAFTIMPFPETPVCMVSVDSLTNYNVVIWEKPTSDLIADFLVYKETDEANVYEVIDTVGYDEETMVTDEGSNPGVRPYRYKIGFVDFENRVFPAGDYHQTIHLTINQGVNGAWNLIWTPYTGFDYSSYKIMRKTDEDIYEQIASVSSSFSSYTDFNAPDGEVYYMIKIEHPDGCNPVNRDGEYASVFSNVASNSIVSVFERTDPVFSIYPVPADKQLNVLFGENIAGNVRLSISDMTGRTVHSEVVRDVNSGMVHRISSMAFNEGIYLLVITSGKNSTTRKIVIRR